MKKDAELLNTPMGQTEVLLHTCCAPCSSAIIECLLNNGIRPVIYYCNPNIYPLEEYLVRKEECTRYAKALGLDIIDDDYDHEAWLEAVKGLENEPERGGRCLKCFKLRLLRTAEYARDNGFKVITTTLASSRWKSLDQINEAGEWACAQVPDVIWWDRNWRKGGLQERRLQIIKEYDFYNQLYCGCEFSNKSTAL
jgi:predicted adenine nucleotide alpha hydrolase (AANH) superfamily ATPase